MVDDCGIIANHYITASSSKVQTIKMTWQRFYKSSTNSPSENWTKPLKGTLSTSEINRKTKSLILMSPPFAHSQKHVIFVSACVTRLIVTGLSWAFKIIALADGFCKNGASLCQRVSIFAKVLKRRICNWKRSLAPRTKMFTPWKINTHQAAVITSTRTSPWREKGISFLYLMTYSRSSQKLEYSRQLCPCPWIQRTHDLHNPLWNVQMDSLALRSLCLIRGIPEAPNSRARKPTWCSVYRGRYRHLWHWRDRWTSNCKPRQESTRSPSKVQGSRHCP